MLLGAGGGYGGEYIFAIRPSHLSDPFDNRQLIFHRYLLVSHLLASISSRMD
jgi:hypothetical protein